MAKFAHKDGFVYIAKGKGMDPYVETVILSMFDENTDYDIQEIQHEQAQFNLHFRLCLIKTLLYPFELLLCKIFLNKQLVAEKKEFQKLHWKLLTGKVKIREYQELVYTLTTKVLDGEIK